MAAALQGLFPETLRTFITWVPMLPADSPEAAASAAGSFPDAAHFWDGDRTMALELARTLGITSSESIGSPGGDGFAWDVYCAYGRGDADMLRPRFWMHQLAVNHAPRLDPDEFRCRVDLLLTL